MTKRQIPKKPEPTPSPPIDWDVEYDKILDVIIDAIESGKNRAVYIRKEPFYIPQVILEQAKADMAAQGWHLYYSDYGQLDASIIFTWS